MMAAESSMRTTDPANATPNIRSDPHEVAPDVLIYSDFVNTYAVRLGDELLLIDPGFAHLSGAVHEGVRAWTDNSLASAVYTHGHADHAFGLQAFLDAGDRPQIIAQENCLHRFQRYHLTHGFNAHINQRQFSLPEPMFPDRFIEPTLTFREALTQRIGGIEVRYTAARGETDDGCYVWIPEKKYLFTGDLVIWQAPNCGNPQKVQRYPVDWANALETMAGLGAEWMFPGHGLVVEGESAIREMLTNTARYLRSIIDQVLERLNRGETPEQIFHAVEPDQDLAKLPYLAAHYDHPKFIVRNLLRLWGGWWNGNAADLLPVTWQRQAVAIAELAGGIDALVQAGRRHLEQGDSPMAAHFAEWATRAHPGNRPAQELKRDVYGARLREEPSLMAQGIFRAARNDAKDALKDGP